MGSLQEALAKSGQVSERTIREREAQDEIDREDAELRLKTMRVVGVEELKACRTRGAFWRVAKLVLIQEPTLIQAVINLAHRLPHDVSRDQARFIKRLFEARDGINRLPDDRAKVAFVREHFRK